jgi:cytochrome b561
MMRLRSSIDRWGLVARILHWGMFLLFGVTVFIGFYMVDLPRGFAKYQVYSRHKSLGITLLVLAVMRWLWRLIDTAPGRPVMPRWQSIMSSAMVAALYVVMLVIPLSGWLYNSAAGFPLQWFGYIHWPALLDANPSIKVIARQVHEAAVYIFMGLLLVHIAAACKHHWVDRDDIMRRMLPFR